MNIPFRFICWAVLGLPFSTLQAGLAEKPAELQNIQFTLHQNAQAKEPYKIRYEGKTFVVYPGVFSPKYFPDTYWFEKHLKIPKEASFLEIGSGTGLIAVMAALRGADYVTAVDVDPEAVKNTTENAFLNGVAKKMRILEGDVFDPIPKGQTFDVIFWFAPFMHVNQNKASLKPLERAVFDPNYQGIKKYLSQAKKYLSQKGRLYLGFSPTHGDYTVLEQLAKENGWKIAVVEREEQHLPSIPGTEQADSITVMLLELQPLGTTQ